jgi:hypothetical protein
MYKPRKRPVKAKDGDEGASITDTRPPVSTPHTNSFALNRGLTLKRRVSVVCVQPPVRKSTHVLYHTEDPCGRVVGLHPTTANSIAEPLVPLLVAGLPPVSAMKKEVSTTHT